MAVVVKTVLGSHFGVNFSGDWDVHTIELGRL